MIVDIYTDGSSKHNGKPDCVAGWSACFIPRGTHKTFVRYGHLPAPSSNNRGEIMGVLYALHLYHTKTEMRLNFFSDSQYVVKSLNEWRHKWKKSNYAGIKNPDLLIPLFKMWEKHGNCSIEWVKGHADNAGNILADKFAGLGSSQSLREQHTEAMDVVMVNFTGVPNVGTDKRR